MLHIAPRRAAQPASQPLNRALSVCVVDPQTNDYQELASFAEESKIRFEIVTSAEAALRRTRGGSVDLWVVNTELSGLNGFELCGMLKARSSATAVYLVANEYSPNEERMAWRAGATLFGCKGSHDQWLRQWIAHSQRPDHC